MVESIRSEWRNGGLLHRKQGESDTMKVDRASEGQVRQRAYQIFLERGGQSGHEVDDWLQAERELLEPDTHRVQLGPKRKTRDEGDVAWATPHSRGAQIVGSNR